VDASGSQKRRTERWVTSGNALNGPPGPDHSPPSTTRRR
jgi:hypothetical protein